MAEAEVEQAPFALHTGPVLGHIVQDIHHAPAAVVEEAVVVAASKM